MQLLSHIGLFFTIYRDKKSRRKYLRHLSGWNQFVIHDVFETDWRMIRHHINLSVKYLIQWCETKLWRVFLLILVFFDFVLFTQSRFKKKYFSFKRHKLSLCIYHCVIRTGNGIKSLLCICGLSFSYPLPLPWTNHKRSEPC